MHNDSKIIATLGDRGSGKTLYLVYQALKSKLPIYSNFKFYQNDKQDILHPRYNELHVEEILHMDMNPKKILITEAYQYFENRLGMGSFQRYMSYMIFQSRKRRAHFIIDTQLDNTIDNRFMKLCDYIIIAEADYDGFNYYYTDKKSIGTFQIPFKMAEKFWNLYDSWEVIITPQVEDLGEKISLSNKPKLKEKLQILEKKFWAEYGNIDKIKITHAVVDNFILDCDENEVYGPYLYARLRKPIPNK